MTPTQPQERKRERLLFIDEVAEILRRSPSQLRWMIQRGTAPKHAKIGGRLVWRESDVDAYIDNAFAAADLESAA